MRYRVTFWDMETGGTICTLIDAGDDDRANEMARVVIPDGRYVIIRTTLESESLEISDHPFNNALFQAGIEVAAQAHHEDTEEGTYADASPLDRSIARGKMLPVVSALWDAGWRPR